MKVLVAGAALAMMAIAGTAQAQITPDDFQIRTTADLVKLCSADAKDPLQAAAVQFCLGFGVGVFQTDQLRQSATRAKPLYCTPATLPTRAETMASFIAWSKATPAAANLAPAAGVLQFFIQTYPCPAARR
jgi:hypothetical protein